ncbi:perforin-like protein 4 [Plasmodium knowlesi strain H]|uniref:Perforin-like protein 4 n=3 Tax=Plasmodium knowlesi TaxID=5850 RepID=A0A5K1VNI2_PLAKH|nr:perforin-like protein 4, putative [Plasmodium knowlesi strain H]OTN67968.1 putative MAC/perforin [Plasmodium knowlesi]CAA9990170.1 perforin-like protein 4, putative [Plasmodium knowlesi strain H]SBO27449.1 perforin-like protein 4 [Plasmodium knowlesi strain H]SBO28504.1 perforin-like protein 4 [Plasmodium knowlesi strain H]VVS79644.1 perforin-like protein 4, putative [Plasmodium knowlesi strain H]|eukprot:XP_002258131.1 MAC/perforin, putative [Plasmodium knowlesi strain H]
MINHLAAKRLGVWVCLLFTLYLDPKCSGTGNSDGINTPIDRSDRIGPGSDESFSKYIGKGYDILFGYPLPNNELVEDPGFRNEIFDTRNSLDIINQVACHRDEYFNFVEGINDVTHLAMDNINVEDVNSSVIPFSASMPYKSYFADLEIGRKKYLVVQNNCVHKYVTYNLRDTTRHINREFLLETDKLPILEKKDNQKECLKGRYRHSGKNERCAEIIKPWIDFFKKYGTHLVLSAHFGGQSFNSLEVSRRTMEEAKIYSYKYPLSNVTNLDVFRTALLLQGDTKEAGKDGNVSDVRRGRDHILKDPHNELHDEPLNEPPRMREKSMGEKTASLDTRGGNQTYNGWKQQTYAVWKDSIYANLLPVHLDLISLSSFMRKEKKESYEKALVYYNSLYGMDKEKYYLSQDIIDVLADGKQITGSAKGSLILSCPVGYVKSTGFILTYDTSERPTRNRGKKGDAAKEEDAARIRVYPCVNNGEYDISCSHINENNSVISFGWLYCVKYSFVQFETFYANRSQASGGTSLEGKCSEGGSIAFGFKMKLEKNKNLIGMKVKACPVGESKCVINHEEANSDYLLWGFCAPPSFHSINSMQVTYIEQSNVMADVQGACSDMQKNKYDNIFLGFSFSFDNELRHVHVSPCGMKTKYCIHKVGNKAEKNYAGMFLLCRNDGGSQRQFSFPQMLAM